MKRERETEQVLDDTAGQIFDVVRQRDANYRFVNQAMYDPTLVAFFNAKEAFLEELKTRPIAILHMIQSNKELASIWNKFENIWLILFNYFVERLANNPYIFEVYPFFLMQAHQRLIDVPGDGINGFDGTQLVPFLRFLSPRLSEESVALEYYFNQEKSETAFQVDDIEVSLDPPYYVIKYGEVMKRYVEILQRIYDLNGRHGFVLHSHMKDSIADLVGQDVSAVYYSDCMIRDKEGSELLKRIELIAILGVVFLWSSYYERIRITEMVDNDDEDNPRVLVANLSGERPNSAKVFPRTIVPLFIELKQQTKSLVLLLNELIEKGENVVEVGGAPNSLRSVVEKHRKKLFDKEEGLYNTPDKQKNLLLLTLKAMHRAFGVTSDEMLRDYGSSLRCAKCDNLTTSVDLALSLAFCNDACRQLY
jgi:hypothetical protein